MNFYDFAVVTVGLILLFVGAIKGATRIVLGVGSLVAAFLLASWFGGLAGSLLSGMISSEDTRLLIGFGVVFAGTLIVGALLGWLVVKALEIVHLRWIDRLAGAAAGFVATILLFAAFSIPLAAYLPEGSRILSESRLAPSVVRIASAVDFVLPHSLRAKFRQRLESLERLWERRAGGGGGISA